MIMKIRISVALLVIALVLTACKDDNLKTLAKALDDTAHGVQVLQIAVIEAESQHTIDEDAARSLLEFSVKVNVAGQEAVKATRNLDYLNSADKQKLLSILLPVIQTLAVGQNISTDEKITAAIALIQTSLNSVQLVLAAAN